MANEQALTIIENYISNGPNPQFALLIKGKWGSGKTYIIMKLIEKLRSEGKKAIYVTLNGITDIDAIGDQIFRQTHPFLAKKGMIIAGKVLKGVLKSSLKIDFKDLGLDGGSVSTGSADYSLKDLDINPDNGVIVFDDFERCSLPRIQILGYINEFVEHDGFRTIIIANEDEILRQDRDSKSSEIQQLYKNIKEKTIGISIEISSDITDALNFYLDDFKNESSHSFLVNQKENIHKIFLQSKLENLRLLRRVLISFNTLYESLHFQTRQRPDILASLFEVYLALSFEFGSGQIEIGELESIASNYTYFPSNEEREKSCYAVIRRRYPEVDFGGQGLNWHFWQPLMTGFPVITEEMSQMLGEIVERTEEKKPTWLKLWPLNNLDEADVNRLYLELKSEFDQFKLKDEGEFHHTVGIFLYLSKIKQIKLRSKIIIKQAKFYIDSIYNTYLLSWSEQTKNREFFHGWHGHNLHSADTAEYKEVRDYLEKKKKKVFHESYQAQGKTIIELMNSNLDELTKLLLDTAQNKAEYSDYPVLSAIDPKYFARQYSMLNVEKRKHVSYIFEGRYEFDKLNRQLAEEQPWIRKVIAELIVTSKSMSPIKREQIKLEIELQISKNIPPLDNSNNPK